MATFFTFAFSALLIIIWIIAGGFITQASVYLHATRDKDPDLHNAYWFSFWAAFVTWTLVAIFLILIGLSIFGVIGLFSTGVGEEGLAAEYATGKSASTSVTSNLSWITIGFLILALILVLVTGVLSALTAKHIRASKNYDPTDPHQHRAYIDAIVAASLCLGAGGLLVIGMIAYFIIAWQASSKANELAQQQQHQRAANQEAVNNLRGDLVKQQIVNQIAIRQATVQNQLAHLTLEPVM